MKNNTGTIFITKLFITMIITLIILILIKSSSGFKTSFYEQVYDNNFKFAYLNNLYNKYIGNSDILKNVVNTKSVFKEKLIYENSSDYLDGVSLKVDNNYLVPVLESGIVVFIGDKDGYNNTIIIQRIDGIDEWYGNISNPNVKLYDYVEKGTLLGEANGNLYLVYKKNGTILDYEKYIK